MKRITIVIVIAIMYGIPCGAARSQIAARPKGRKPIAPTTKPAKATDRYQRLLIKYLSNIERVGRERSERQVKEYQEAIVGEKSKAAKLAKNKDSVLAKLQAECNKRRSKKIDFIGECYENMNPFIFGISSESADIVETLYKGGAFSDFQEVLQQLRKSPCSCLAKEWVSFLEKIVLGSKRESPIWKGCVKMLYSKGGLRNKYHPTVRSLAVEGKDVGALELLFFTQDAHTSKLKPRITLENLVLSKELSREKYTPGIRVTCAHYALTIRDYDLSQATCKYLMEQKYKGMQNVDAEPPEEDMVLYGARNAAMTLMFCGLKNEKMFRLLYRRATIEHREPAAPPVGVRPSPNTPKWISFTTYVYGRMEVGDAKAFMHMVREWNQQGKGDVTNE